MVENHFAHENKWKWNYIATKKGGTIKISSSSSAKALPKRSEMHLLLLIDQL